MGVVLQESECWRDRPEPYVHNSGDKETVSYFRTAQPAEWAFPDLRLAAPRTPAEISYARIYGMDELVITRTRGVVCEHMKREWVQGGRMNADGTITGGRQVWGGPKDKEEPPPPKVTPGISKGERAILEELISLRTQLEEFIRRLSTDAIPAD